MNAIREEEAGMEVPNVSMTAEQLHEIIRASRGEGKHFSSCQANFSGDRNPETVEGFIQSASIFKRVERLSDADAIAEMPLLLRERTTTWWSGVKSQITTWEKAMDELRTAFAPKKPDYVILMAVSQSKQGIRKSSEDFIAEKRSLLAKLAHPMPEELKISTAYGLLRTEVTSHIDNNRVISFEDLIRECRQVESRVIVTKS